MIRIGSLLFTASVVLACAGQAAAQSSATTSAEARASVIRTIALAPIAPLSFGVLAADAQPADVTVSPSGEVTASRPGVIVPSARSAGAFDVTGQANRVYLVDLPATVNLTAGSQTMTVRNLALQFQGAPSTGGTGQLSAEGRQSFTVGGTLGLGASQAPGDYVGAYSVTARYQ